MIKAYYALVALSDSIGGEVIKKVYIAYFHTVTAYDVILWGNSSDSIRVFKMLNAKPGRQIDFKG